MSIENPYQSPEVRLDGRRSKPLRASFLHIFGWLFGSVVFGVCLLLTMGIIYFTLNPGALQAGNRTARASFDNGDYPELLTEIGIAVGFAVAMGVCAVKAIATTRTWLRQWSTRPTGGDEKCGSR